MGRALAATLVQGGKVCYPCVRLVWSVDVSKKRRELRETLMARSLKSVRHTLESTESWYLRFLA